MADSAGGNAAVPGAQGALASPLEAVDDLRSAAKWTLAAAGAVGAALISGGPLVAVGQVHGLGHALLAGLGLALALAGVGIAVWSTSKVLAPRLTSRRVVMSPRLAALRQEIETDPEQFLGLAATSVAGLFKHQDDQRQIAADLARQAAAEENARRRAVLESQLHRVEENAARVATYTRYVMALAHVWQLQDDLTWSRRCTLGGGLLVIAGAVLFFLAAGGPTYVPVLTPQVTTAPSATAPPTAVPHKLPSPSGTPLRRRSRTFASRRRGRRRLPAAGPRQQDPAAPALPPPGRRRVSR